MYRNLNPLSIGISGRQSELIELALTYGFKGISADVVDLVRRAVDYDVEHVCRFHKSAKVEIGTFELPSTWRGPEDQFQAFLKRDLESYIEIARELGAQRAVLSIEPGSDLLPYHENFEQHRQRLAEIAAKLSAADIALGLGLRAARPVRQNFAYQFIFQPEDLITLIKSIAGDNVGLWFDAWNWKVGGGTLAQLQEWPVDRLVAVELSDAPAELDLAEIGEDQRLLPGAGGAIDAQSIVNYLRDADYSGPVTPSASHEALAGRTREEIVQQASQAMETLWVGAGLSKPSITAPVATAAEESAEAEPETAAEGTGGGEEAASGDEASEATAQPAAE